MDWTAATWTFLILYWLWVLAGWFDFACHRRSDLPSTSGLRESRLHLLQLALCGTSSVLVLALRSSAGLAALLLAIVLAHAWAGYRDTRSAFEAGRVVTPIEQHVHSVLDMAPWIAWALVALHARHAPAIDWGFSPRRPAADAALWSAVLFPALALCVAPALREFHDSWRVARARPHA